MGDVTPHAGAPDLAAENEALLEFLYVAPVGLMELSSEGEINIMNPLAAQLLIPIAGAQSLTNLFLALEDCAPDLRFMVSAFAEPRGVVCDGRRLHVGQSTDRTPRILACTVIKVDATRLMVVLTDVSEQVAQERRLAQTESWFSLMLAGVNDFALLSLDANGRISSWNKSGERQTGHTPDEVVGRTMNVFYLPDEAVQGRALQQVDFARREGWHIDQGWRRKKDGSRYWCQSLVSALEDRTGGILGFSVVLRDVTENKTSSEEIRRLLTTDQLTGVLNRARFFELAESELMRSRRFKQPISCLMIDLDHFKGVNDTYGHAAGDTVLEAVAAVFRRSLRSIDIVGRVGGEEFAVVLPTVSLEGARSIGELLRREVSSLCPVLDGAPVPVTISIGCAELEHGEGAIDRLLKSADAALYAAKRDGRNRVSVQA